MSTLSRTLSALAVTASLSTQALAVPVVWGVNATFNDGSVLTGTISFDDAPVAGFYDGYNDPNDTHIDTSTWTLTFAPLGWTNKTFTDVSFQPYRYSSFENNDPHVDWGLEVNGKDTVVFDIRYYAKYFNARGKGTAGTWSFDRNLSAVPEPTKLSLFFMGLGLVGMRTWARRKQR